MLVTIILLERILFMYYNRILRVWVLDLADYFLISALVGNLLAPRLKKYLSEKAAMERLKNSIIKKSDLMKLKKPISSTKEAKIKQLYRFALDNRGGQFEEFQADLEFSDETFKLAHNIKDLVERLAGFLKQRELKGIAKIFFKSGRLIVELILCKCNINITYSPVSEGLSTQVIVFTVAMGGTGGFVLSWFSVGGILVTPVALISFLSMRSAIQQISNLREYSKFKKMVDKILDDEETKQTLRAFFIEGEGPTSTSGTLKMELLDFDKESALKHDFNLKSDENFEEFIKTRMKEQFGLIENPTEKQLEEIINKNIRRKPKGKTVFFRDFINENPYEGPNLSHSDIIDAEILEKTIPMKSDNEL